MTRCFFHIKTFETMKFEMKFEFVELLTTILFSIMFRSCVFCIFSHPSEGEDFQCIFLFLGKYCYMNQKQKLKYLLWLCLTILWGWCSKGNRTETVEKHWESFANIVNFEGGNCKVLLFWHTVQIRIKAQKKKKKKKQEKKKNLAEINFIR